MKDPLGVSPSKGNKGTTRGKEKFLLTSVGIEPTTSELDLPLLCRLSTHSTLIYTSELILCSHICVYSATRRNIHNIYSVNEDKYVERIRKDFSLNDDQIIHEFDQDVISGKTTPEKIDVDVIPFIESLRSGLSKLSQWNIRLLSTYNKTKRLFKSSRRNSNK